MLRKTAVVMVSLIACSPSAEAQRSAERQIAEAVSALPEPLRSGASVKGYAGSDELVTLREGEGPLVCLADDPEREGWHVACYHRDMEAFMARGRELRAQGITDRAQIDSIRGAEIEAGALPMPDHPTTLYSWFGPEGAFDPETGEPEGVQGLYVVYTPYATEASTGLSTASSDERPWLMFPGKPWAHIMISR